VSLALGCASCTAPQMVKIPARLAVAGIFCYEYQSYKRFL
jgi:hypothetical protein